MKIELILPDGMDERYWEQIQKVKMNYLPVKGAIINACNKNGYSRPFVVTGTRTVFELKRWKSWGRKIKNNRVYLEECHWPREFNRNKIND